MRDEEWGTDLSKAFGSASTLVAFDALATPVPTACDDFLFFNNTKKRKQKMPLSCAERLAQRKSLL